MSLTNAQAAVIAASNTTIEVRDLNRGGGITILRPGLNEVVHNATELKKWLDGQDEADAKADEIKAKGTIDERLAALEGEVFA